MVNIEDLVMSVRSPVEMPEGVNMSTIEEESHGLDMSDLSNIQQSQIFETN